MLLIEAFIWAFALGAFGARKWLAIGMSVLLVSGMYLAQTALALIESVSIDNQIALGTLAGVAVLSALAIGAIGASAGGAVWAWAASQLYPEEEAAIDEGEAEAEG
jgi:hypothetical protein